MKGLHYKILIAGVGGQGIVFISNILAETALRQNVPIHISEIHGLSQRGGTVTSGIGLGEGCTGFAGSANVDLLIGLEPLEVQRCLLHLHQGSAVVFGDYKIPPASVNEGRFMYPDINTLRKYLSNNCRQVLFAGALPAGIPPVRYNMFLLGVTTGVDGFPFTATQIVDAMHSVLPEHHLKNSILVFEQGVDKIYELKKQYVG